MRGQQGLLIDLEYSHGAMATAANTHIAHRAANTVFNAGRRPTSSITILSQHVCRQCRSRQLIGYQVQRYMSHSQRARRAEDTATHPPTPTRQKTALDEDIEKFLARPRNPNSQTHSSIDSATRDQASAAQTSPSGASTPSTKSLADVIREYITPTDSLRSILDPSHVEASRRPPSLELKPPPFRLGPVSGRTVRVDSSRGTDVGRAFERLERVVRENRVRAEYGRQRFHERPGLKRKRLRSERWRRQFKQGFYAMLERSRQLKSMGW